MEEHLESTNIVKNKNVIIARPVKIEKIGKQDVYNMEVKDLHNYIANGIVVHNCRYIIMEFKLSGRCPVV